MNACVNKTLNGQRVQLGAVSAPNLTYPGLTLKVQKIVGLVNLSSLI